MSLYDGALANGVLSLIGHYPWFLMHNYLDYYIPAYENRLFLSVIRNALIGFLSSCVSDVVSNSIRVVKVSVQTNSDKGKSYGKIIKEIVKKEGIKGVLFRGLGTRLLTNGVQGVMFNTLWKYFGRK